MSFLNVAAPEMVSVSGSVKGEDDSQVMINMSPLGSLGFVHSAGKQIAIERGQTGDNGPLLTCC